LIVQLCTTWPWHNLTCCLLSAVWEGILDNRAWLSLVSTRLTCRLGSKWWREYTAQIFTKHHHHLRRVSFSPTWEGILDNQASLSLARQNDMSPLAGSIERGHIGPPPLCMVSTQPDRCGCGCCPSMLSSTLRLHITHVQGLRKGSQTVRTVLSLASKRHAAHMSLSTRATRILRMTSPVPIV
jgi:hypothetical protein